MKVIKFEDTTDVEITKSWKSREYDFGYKDLDLGIITVNGRIPESGYAYNERIKELAFVLKGSGVFVTKSDKIELHSGDAVLIDENEPYYLEGEMTLAISCHPAFDITQHKMIEN